MQYNRPGELFLLKKRSSPRQETLVEYARMKWRAWGPLQNSRPVHAALTVPSRSGEPVNCPSRALLILADSILYLGGPLLFPSIAVKYVCIASALHSHSRKKSGMKRIKAESQVLVTVRFLVQTLQMKCKVNAAKFLV